MKKDLTPISRRPPSDERKKIARQWYQENKEAIDAYNTMVEADGFLFSDGASTF